jgi:hypothetical protein
MTHKDYPDGHEPRLFLAKALAQLGANVTYDSPIVEWEGAQRHIPGFHINGKRMLYLLDNRMPDNQWQNDAALWLLRNGEEPTFVFCAQKTDADKHSEFNWLPLGVTPGYIHKHGLASYDFSFVGYLNDHPRQALMERLQELFAHNIKSGVFAGEAIDAYIQGRVGLNVPAYIGTKFAYDVNMRVFEIAALKVPLLTADVQGMEELGFRQGVNCLMYRNGAELIRLMEILLANEPLRSSIAEAGYDLVQREHTYIARAHQLMSVVGG